MSITSDGHVIFNLLQPNLLAFIILTALISPLYYFMRNLINICGSGTLNAGFNHKITIINGAVIVFSLYMLVLTASRGALAGFITGFIITGAALCYIVRSKLKTGHFVTAGIMTLIAAGSVMVLLPDYYERIISVFNSEVLMSGSERGAIWSAAWSAASGVQYGAPHGRFLSKTLYLERAQAIFHILFKIIRFRILSMR